MLTNKEDVLTYKKITDIPMEYQYIISKLIGKGLIKLDEKKEFFLTREMLEIILIMVRAGLL